MVILIIARGRTAIATRGVHWYSCQPRTVGLDSILMSRSSSAIEHFALYESKYCWHRDANSIRQYWSLPQQNLLRWWKNQSLISFVFHK
jgi:hypothetical protein